MNKSKFLKRSLAAILAILMVVAMVPSALAAQVVAESVPTARAAVDPGYNISVNGNKTEWDPAAEAYTAKEEFTEGQAVPVFKVSMIPVSKTTVSVTGKDGVDLDTLGSGLNELEPKDAVQSVDSFGAGTYTYTLTAVTTDDNGDDTTYTFKLIVTATMKVNSTDASIKAIKTAKLYKIISAKFDNDKNTIELVKALGADDDIKTSATGNAELDEKAELQPVFIPTSDNISNMTYDKTSKKLTVTAQNGDKKVYTVSFTEEPAFDSFKLGDYEGKAKVTAGVTDPKVINVILPYSYIEYASSTQGDTNKVDVAKVNKLANSWTVATGTKVEIEGEAAESGDELVFAVPGSGNSTTIGDVDYWLATLDSSHDITVQTKKSVSGVAVAINVLVPKENPEAKLTKIQIGANNQIVNIPDGQTTVNVTMPYEAGVSNKSDLDDAVIKVWGSVAATVELARDFKAESSNDAHDGNGFSGDGSGVEITSSGVDSGDNTIDISKTVYINVKSEDEKTTTLYTINVTPGQAGASNRVLKSLEFLDDEDKVVATGTISGSDVKITVPFATGIDPWGALAGLKVRAVASDSAKIQVSNNTLDPDDGSATAAVYETKFKDTPPTEEITVYTAASNDTPPVPTWDVNVNGVHVSVDIIGNPATAQKVMDNTDPDNPQHKTETAEGDNKGKYMWTFTPDSTKALADYKDAIKTALNNLKSDNWGFEIGSTPDSEGKYTVTMTATDAHKGAVDADSEDAKIKPALSWTEKKKGLNGNRPRTITVDMDTLANYNEAVTLAGIINTTFDSSNGKYIEIPTAGVTGDKAAGNQFKIKVYYGTGDADNEKTEYTVTIYKKAPSTAGTISSVEVTNDDDTDPDDTHLSYKATASGSKQNGKIVVAPLPHALSPITTAQGADAANAMRFSKLEVSEGAKVVVVVDKANDSSTAVGPYTVTKDDDGKVTAYSTNQFTVHSSDSDNWTKSGKEVLVYVYSEKDWAAIGKAADADATKVAAVLADVKKAANAREYAPTTLYKMSASYIAAENGSKLTNIASTLDENVKVAKGTNTYTITVPSSYVKDDSASKAGKAFTLNFVPVTNETPTSKLATVHANAVSGTTNLVKSDEGNSKKADATKFAVIKNDDEYELKTVTVSNGVITASGSAIGKFVVESESKSSTSPYDIVVKVAAAETSNAIESITVDGQKAVVGADGETWTVTLPYGTTDLVKLVDIKTVSKLAAVTVDEAEYKPEDYYDLGADLVIKVTAENGEAFTYTLKTVVSDVKPPVEVPSDSYSDIPNNYATEWIKKAIDAGIMGHTGTDADGKKIFAPEETTERRWFALMVARADIMASDDAVADKDAADKKLLADYGDKEPDFTDTANEADTAKAAIAYCQEKGIMNGDAGKFNPAGIVNRMEAASILKNWLKLPEGDKTENTHNFKDWDKIPNWAKGNINAVATDKIMEGNPDNTFGTSNLTRQQTAVIMVKAYDRLKGSK